jgi:hypothetical protein
MSDNAPGDANAVQIATSASCSRHTMCQAARFHASTQQKAQQPIGVSRALGCWDMEGLPPTANLDNPQLREALQFVTLHSVNNVLAYDS